MNYNNNNNQMHYVSMSGFMTKVYAWMSYGLFVTAGVSYYILSSPTALFALKSHVLGVFGLMIFALVLCIGLVSLAPRLNFALVAAGYTAYTFIQGIILPLILMNYTGSSVVAVFISTALMFLGMALYGTFTKSDLSSMNNLLLMGIWGLIIGGLVNAFLGSSLFSMMLSAIGVGIFSMLIATNVQMLNQISRQNSMMTSEDKNKFAIIASLSLYMNVINLFLDLLRLFGEERKK